MEDVRVVFTASSKVSSRIIRWLTRSPVSHVYIEYESVLWGGRWAAEATKGGVRKVIAKKARHDVYAEFRCKFDVERGLAAVSKYFGEDYDYIGVAIFGALIVLGRWFSVKVKSPFRSSKSQFCSEFVTRFFKGARLEGVAGWDVGKSSPGRLYRFCEKNTGKFKQLRREEHGVQGVSVGT